MTTQTLKTPETKQTEINDLGDILISLTFIICINNLISDQISVT